MPVLEGEEVEILEGAEASSDDLKISESISVQEGGVQDDGTVLMHLIRPCVGRGRGKHLYRAEMLEANAGVFEGWKMYVNHLSDQARRALGGLPRDVRDVGGIVQESWWDADVPAEGRFGKGAVIGKVKPVPLVQELLRVDPRLVEASINATATACKPGKVGQEQVWIVEGIESKGSVDWVTEAGAGGRVATIMEAMIEDGSAVTGALDTLDNGTILAWIEKNRPDLTEALKNAKPKGDAADDVDGDGDEADDEAEIASLLKSGKAKTRAQAVALVAGKKNVKESDDGGDEVPDLTPEALTEALSSDEGQAVLAPIIASAVVAAVKDLDLGREVVKVVEAKLEEDREVIRAEATAHADRRNELRDMRDFAHRRINESKLSGGLKTRALANFDLVEGTPTAGLDLVNDEDDNGKVEKSAMQKLTEAVDSEITDSLAIMAEINPTRVRGAGPTSLTEGNGGKDGKDLKEGEEAKPDTTGEVTRSLLEGIGVKGDLNRVYEVDLDSANSTRSAA